MTTKHNKQFTVISQNFKSSLHQKLFWQTNKEQTKNLYTQTFFGMIQLMCWGPFSSLVKEKQWTQYLQPLTEKLHDRTQCVKRVWLTKKNPTKKKEISEISDVFLSTTWHWLTVTDLLAKPLTKNPDQCCHMTDGQTGQI